MSVSLKHGIVLIAATASLGAAGTHFAVIDEHLQEYALFGYLFLALAWFQAVWAIAFLMRSSVPIGWLGIIVNGLLFTVPKKQLPGDAYDALAQQALDSVQNRTRYEPPVPGSITEHTTQHLKS